MRTLLLFMSTLAAIAGCTRVSDVNIGATTITKRMLSTNDLDILFVVDNSTSTSDKQSVFAQNFPRFVQALDAFPTGRPNVHIGIVDTTVDIGAQGFGPSCPSPDPGDDGLLQNTARVTGCTPPTGRFISDVKDSSGVRTVNYTGTLADAFSCIAQVGAAGCGFEAPLEAMKRALDGSRPENAGFIRDAAYLAVIILTDEDDASVADPALFSLPMEQVGPADFRAQPMYAYTCDHPISLTPDTYNDCVVRTGSYLATPDSYVQFLATIKDPSQTAVAVIGGDPQSTIQTGPITFYGGGNQSLALLPSCTATINGNPAIARPGIRLDAFRHGFDTFDHGLFETVCQPDYSNVLTEIGQKLFTMTSPCLEGNLDTSDQDAQNPGTQPACTVTQTGPGVPDVQLPACAMFDATTPAPGGARPCWWIATDASCMTATNFVLHVERDQPAPDGSELDAQCAVAH